jgi:hypothetical protein
MAGVPRAIPQGLAATGAAVLAAVLRRVGTVRHDARDFLLAVSAPHRVVLNRQPYSPTAPIPASLPGMGNQEDEESVRKGKWGV